MIKKNQAEKKELSILLYILNDSVYKDHWLRGVSEHSQAEFRLELSKAGLIARVFHGLHRHGSCQSLPTHQGSCCILSKVTTINGLFHN